MKKNVKKEVIAGIMLILIDIFNLAEQFGIYFIARETPQDETTQQRFFLILFGVGGVTLIRPMLLWTKLKTVFSMLIEVGELVAYLILLPRTSNLIVVASVFFGVQVLFHLIALFTGEPNLSSITLEECARDVGCFPMRVLMYGLIYSSPILFLFLDSQSKFRDVFYEVLMILNVFFGVSYIDASIAPCCVTDQEPATNEVIYLIWQTVTFVIYNILGLMITIVTLVFAGQAIRAHATGETTLSQYDFGVYIYCLVSSGLLALGLLMSCYIRSCQAVSQDANK